MSKLLEDFSEFIKNNRINVYRIAEIMGDGEPSVVELTECNPCQNSYSVAKLFTLTAIGMLWDEGRISTNEYITDILAPYCPKEIDHKWHNTTVDMVIRHHCGLPEGYLDIDCNDATIFGNDYLAYIFNTPVGDTSEHVYTDAAYYLLARAATERAGLPITEYLWNKLFYKLGFNEVAWSTCPMNHCMGATGLYIRTEDMAKLGALYLNKGIYKGERLLSEAWISKARAEGYLPGYEYYGFGHGGMCGQMLLILPNHNRALAWHGYHSESSAIKEFLSEYLTKTNHEDCDV